MLFKQNTNQNVSHLKNWKKKKKQEKTNVNKNFHHVSTHSASLCSYSFYSLLSYIFKRVFFLKLYWNIITLQCCISFHCMANCFLLHQAWTNDSPSHSHFLINSCSFSLTFMVAQTGKRLPTMQETQVRSLGWEDPLEKAMASHSVLLPGKSHGQRSLVGYSPWGHKESDTTERLHFHI